MILDHVGFNVSDFAASKRFYGAALAPLGIGVAAEGDFGAGPRAHWPARQRTKPAKCHFWARCETGLKPDGPAG